MIKSRTAQLVFLSMACAIGVIGVISSVGFFDYVFKWDFYIYFTNLSNYLCVGILIAELVATIKKKEDSYITTAPLLKFMGLLAILLTFLVFNLILAPYRDIALNFDIRSVSLHVIIPVMYVLDWILFYDRKANWKYPLFAVIIPLVYVIYVYIHAACWGFDSSVMNFVNDGALIYPYFFFNIDLYGVGGVLGWLGILAVLFIGLGYLMFGVDRLILKHQILSEKNSQKEIQQFKTVASKVENHENPEQPIQTPVENLSDNK